MTTPLPPSASPHMMGIDYVQAVYGQPSPFPPTFEGNPWSYGFGLFGDVVAAALALTMLLTFIFEKRRHRQIHIILNTVSHDAPITKWSPLWLYRSGMMCFLSFVVMRAVPEALWMLAWGEVSLPTIEFLLRFDLISDGVSIIPLAFATVFWAWGRQVIPQQLTTGLSRTSTGGPPWDAFIRNGRIVAIVIVIAILVTIGKANG